MHLRDPVRVPCSHSLGHDHNQQAGVQPAFVTAEVASSEVPPTKPPVALRAVDGGPRPTSGLRARTGVRGRDAGIDQ